jgi:hypothetical protein
MMNGKIFDENENGEKIGCLDFSKSRDTISRLIADRENVIRILIFVVLGKSFS